MSVYVIVLVQLFLNICYPYKTGPIFFFPF